MKNNQLYPTDLTDRQWDCIKELIPAAKPGGHPRTLEMRAVVNAIVYLLVTGCQWRMLPREYPAWQSVYTYFRHWRDDGTWPRLHDTLRAQVRKRAGRQKGERTQEAHPGRHAWIADGGHPPIGDAHPPSRTKPFRSALARRPPHPS